MLSILSTKLFFILIFYVYEVLKKEKINTLLLALRKKNQIFWFFLFSQNKKNIISQQKVKNK